MDGMRHQPENIVDSKDIDDTGVVGAGDDWEKNLREATAPELYDDIAEPAPLNIKGKASRPIDMPSGIADAPQGLADLGSQNQTSLKEPTIPELIDQLRTTPPSSERNKAIGHLQTLNIAKTHTK